MACNNNDRLVEQVIGRVLGRPIYSIRERLAWSILIAERGFNYFVDSILDRTSICKGLVTMMYRDKLIGFCQAKQQERFLSISDCRGMAKVGEIV